MSLTLFVIRHAATNWSKLGFLSETDLELNEKGEKQAKELAIKLKNHKIDKIFSSPMKRALSTAREIAKNKEMEVLIENDLKEVNFGVFEGLSLEEAREKYSDLFEKRSNDKWNFTIPNGESYKSAYERITKFIKKIKKEFDNKSVVLVTHATLINLLLVYFSKYTKEEAANTRLDVIKEANCLKINLYDDGRIELNPIN